MSDRIRVGIVGASPTRGWALGTHLPAIRALDAFELAAVATTREVTAAQAAEQFGASRWYASGEALASDPDVDVVTVSVKVPHHYAIVRAALEAGKHVYCEWPLGRTSEEADELASLARERSVANVVGLQGRQSAVVRFARDLLASGEIGDCYFASLSIEGVGNGGRTVPEERAWAADRSNGVTTLSIIGGHNLDALRFIAGDFAEVRATVGVRSPNATIAETGAPIAVSSPDVVLVNGTLVNGAYLSVAVQAGLPKGFGARLELHGSEGVVVIEGGTSLHLSDEPLRLSAARRGGELVPLEVPTELVTVPESVPAGNARNVAGLYLVLRNAIAGASVEPDFHTALGLHRIVDAIDRSATTGERVLLV